MTDTWRLSIPDGVQIKDRIRDAARQRKVSQGWVAKVLLEHALDELESKRINIQPVSVEPTA